MSSWRAVLKADGPICVESVEARRAVLQSRGVKRVRISDPAFTDLRSLLRESPYIVAPEGKPNVWAMANEDRSQYTIGMLEYSGEWRAVGWTAEHLVCMTLGLAMPTIKDSGLILKPRVRRMILERGSLCHFCTEGMSLQDITIEHWLAKSRKGSSHPSNLKLAHRRCNEMAGSMSIREKNRLRQKLSADTELRAEFLHRRNCEC